ncbi:M20 family metallopeptidase [Agrococcus carbonis]|uniref:Acetylornithine deacetylase n=1 Tax=Agrococcus carbonis TaxID=684552 RepID=A0A1H1P941_9MICO|nr:M20 family metallopeptidase [Agrococcus carbonis]SDS07590.1 acetylornithine deacetylase [Agrococcus carbonis]
MTDAAARDACARRALDLVDEATIVADASSLILAASENPGGTELVAVRVLEAIASRLGARTRRTMAAPDRPNLSIRFGPEPTRERPGVLMLGHSDVVPAGSGWSADPFNPRVEGGWLTGRGAVDMKGGIAAALQAMGAVSAVCPELPLELLVTADEEDLATGIQAHLAADDEDPHRYLACIVAEPTDLAVVVACRGAANLEVEVAGRAAHAGRPEDGASAITTAAHVAAWIADDHRRMREGASGLLGSATWSVGRIEGGHGTSIVPDRCTLLVDRRLMPDETGADALAQLDAGIAHVLDDESRQAAPGAACCTARTRLLMEMPGFETDPTHPLVTSAVGALAAEGVAAPVEAWTAACEGGFVARHHGCPTIILGPGDITGQAHQPDERVLVSHLSTAARAYTRMLVGLQHEPAH